MLVTIMTDASWCSEYKVAGYGYWLASKRGKSGGGGKMGVPVYSSNCAEMMAIGNALYHAVALQIVVQHDTILFQTDSAHAIRAFTGKPTTLTQQQKEVLEYVSKVVTTLNLTLQFRHVKAHSGKDDRRSIANSMCDKRAKEAMRAARSLIRLNQIEKELLQ